MTQEPLSTNASAPMPAVSNEKVVAVTRSGGVAWIALISGPR
ncbi:hypothetical protein ACMAVG_005318 [Burkholderia cenocepacia]